MRPARLFLDDLDEIIALLREVSQKIEIKAEGFELENLDEITSLKKPYITSLEIKSTDPYISVDFRPYQIWLYSAKDDAVSRGTFEGIRTVIRRCRRPFAWLAQASYPIVGAFVPLCFFALMAAVSRRDFRLVTLAVVGMVGAVAWGYRSYKSQSQRFSVIMPKHRQDAPNFWQRNSDKIILAVISGCVGAAIKTLFDAFTSHK